MFLGTQESHNRNRIQVECRFGRCQGRRRVDGCVGGRVRRCFCRRGFTCYFYTTAFDVCATGQADACYDAYDGRGARTDDECQIGGAVKHGWWWGSHLFLIRILLRFSVPGEMLRHTNKQIEKSANVGAKNLFYLFSIILDKTVQRCQLILYS